MVKNRIIAKLNSKKRFGESESIRRKRCADDLRNSRVMDRCESWGISFDASLEILNKSFHLNLVKLIKKEKKKGKKVKVVSVGCGTGRAENELKKVLGENIELHATGVARSPRWNLTENSKNINWHVTHGNALSKIFKTNSVDFVYSRLGIHHSKDVIENSNFRAYNELSKILRPGGLALIDLEGEFNQKEIPKNLKVISNNFYFEKQGKFPEFFMVYPHRVVVLKKIAVESKQPSVSQ